MDCRMSDSEYRIVSTGAVMKQARKSLMAQVIKDVKAGAYTREDAQGYFMQFMKEVGR